MFKRWRRHSSVNIRGLSGPRFFFHFLVDLTRLRGLVDSVMKPRNVIQSFPDGWKVGLSDNNHVVVETPTKKILQPYIGPRNTLFGKALNDGDDTADTIKIPVAVASLVETLWKKQEQLEQDKQVQAQEEIEEIARELTEEDEGNPTLEDLGFGDSVRIEEI